MMPGRIVEVGGVPVLLRVEDRALQEAVDKWYADYLTTKPSAEPFELTVKVAPDGGATGAISRASNGWKGGGYSSVLISGPSGFPTPAAGG